MNWDQYWRANKDEEGLYGFLAGMYRRLVITEALRHYTNKYMPSGDDRVYLHAGCGTGKSDERLDFEDSMVVLLDRSVEGLKTARKATNFPNVGLVCADLRHLPFKDGTMDGVWNLGVMEHLPESDLVTGLREFGRTLAVDGRFVLFWPPVYGLTVMLLHSILFVANKVFRQNLDLFPDEVSLYTSRARMDELAKRSHTRVLKTHFSMRDLFTQVVVVGGPDDRDAA